MNQITVQIEGMSCSMCESHINEVIRKKFRVQKVSSSHSKGECVIISKEPISADQIRQAIESTGYTVSDVRTEPYEKKGFLRFRI